MPEHIYALAMVFLEMVFFFAVLAALHNQRKVIGHAAFAAVMVVLPLFNALLTAADVRAQLCGTLTFPVGETAVYLPMLTAFLMIYVTMGILAAQRLLIGVVVSYLIYLYFGQMTMLQSSWSDFSLSGGIAAGTVNFLLSAGRMTVNASAISHLLEFIIAPMIYNRCINWRFPRWLAIVAALYCAQLIWLLPALSIGFGTGTLIDAYGGVFIARQIGTAILSAMLIFYVNQLETEISEVRTGALDFLFAFFGSYGKIKELENDLRDWEGRYQQVLRQSAEVIVLCNADGVILEANIAAGKFFNCKNPQHLTGSVLFDRISITEPENFDPASLVTRAAVIRCKTGANTPQERTLAGSISPVTVKKHLLLTLVGRDVTEELRLANEKAALAEQLIHAQRLESLGILAGGIAHDFNNFIHAILGHVDVATLLDAGNPEAVTKHLNQIGMIADKAGKLTSEMLGFARRGKYNAVPLELSSFLPDIITLLGPHKLSGIDFALALPKPGLRIFADRIQIQQVLLNLLINAVDALQNVQEKKLLLAAGHAESAPLKFQPPPEKKEELSPGDFVYLSVTDNGCGMTGETAKRIYEPFFTTKPAGVGTGMGLSMVYGTVENHKGWLQLRSAPGEGTTFCIFLPKYNDER